MTTQNSLIGAALVPLGILAVLAMQSALLRPAQGSRSTEPWDTSPKCSNITARFSVPQGG